MDILHCHADYVDANPTSLAIIESCNSTWTIDLAQHRYRRSVRSEGSSTPAATDWELCFAIEFDDDGEGFVLWLNESGSRRLRSWRHLPGCTSCNPTTELRLAAIADAGSAS